VTETTNCPHCGAEIRADAHFCRHCGSSDSDGWRGDTESEGLDEFDYDEYLAENFPESTRVRESASIWRVVALVLLVAFAMGLLVF
jgi:uncharacterized membrane protein YvbJ